MTTSDQASGVKVPEADEAILQLMRNAKVMMVDDEPINMRVLQLLLTNEGYSCFVTVCDSTTAMSVLRSEKPDVLLLDLNMPQVSGLDILEQIRADKKLNHMPVIVLTSSSNTDTKFKALSLGATDFLAKPVHPSELALRMRNTLISRAYEQKIKQVDELTNLPNRLFFASHLQQYDARALTRHSCRVLVLINLHRFKSINDSFGSARGDDVLWAFSRRLRNAFAEAEGRIATLDSAEGRDTMVMRLGGDRFAALVETQTQPSRDTQLKQRIDSFLHALQEPFIVDAQRVYLNVRIGISVIDETATSVEALINCAETAMNHAGVSSYAFFNADMLSEARRNLVIENALRTSIIDDELFLTYQPKVDVQSGQIIGAEALLRWTHPELGNVPPCEFIPVAESSGQIVEIGQWVLEQACLQTALVRQAGFKDFRMAVNASIAQLNDQSFLSGVKTALEKASLPSEALIIELTENMIMEDIDSSMRKLAVLRELGIRISIDDFGTGYSSLSYLQKFPIDQLKIDRSFIMQIASADATSPIVKAIVMLAHDLKLEVVAEGVETDVQLAYIKSLSCDEYQGYYKSPPVQADPFMTLLMSEALPDEEELVYRKAS